ncbi:hypothetical protein ES703_109357 [subsurface metagenome]
MDISRARHGQSLGYLVYQIKGIARAGGSHVGYIVRGGNRRHVLFPGNLSDADFAGGRGGRRSAKGGSRRALDTGIHVGFVVKADIKEVVSSFHSPGQCLNSDITGAAITGNTYHLDIPPRASPLSFHGFVAGFNSGGYGGSILKQGMNPGEAPGRVREL